MTMNQAKQFDWCLDDVESDEILGMVMNEIDDHPEAFKAPQGNIDNNTTSANSMQAKTRSLPAWAYTLSIENDLHVSPRWSNHLSTAGIQVLSDLFGKSVQELETMRGIGRIAIEEIRAGLRVLSLPSLEEICEMAPIDRDPTDKEAAYVGHFYTKDPVIEEPRFITFDNLLGKDFDVCKHQDSILSFLGVSFDDAAAIRDFCEKNRLSWFSSLWNKFSEIARITYGPDEPLETLIDSSIDHLITDLGTEAFILVVNELISVFNRKLEVTIEISSVFDAVRAMCPSELMLVRVEWLTKSLYADSRDNRITIANGFENNELDLVELYAIQKAVIALTDEYALYRQAADWEMLFAQSIYDALGSFQIRAMTVYLPRIGVTSEGRPPTLEEVGNGLGLTRERVRQVEKKFSEEVAFENIRRLIPLRICLYSAVVELAGGDTVERIRELVHSTGLDLGKLNVANIVKLLPELEYDPETKLIALSSMPCAACDRAIDCCKRLVESDGYFTAAEFYERVGCGKCTFPIKPDLRLFEAAQDLSATEDYIGKTSNPIIAAQTRPTSIRACIKATLFSSKRSFTIQELADIATAHTGKKVSKTAVNSLVTSMENCSLWGRGTYIYDNNMPRPIDLLKKIADYCCMQFARTNVPLVGAGGVYEVFSKLLQHADVPNEQALYSLLRKHPDKRLELREYPWICCKETIRDRTTFAKYFYSVVEANNGFISDAHAREVADKAMTQSWALDGLSHYSKLLIHANGGWFNIETAGFDLDGVALLAREIADKMRDNDIVSCKKVFENNKERCYSYGVKSYDILYRLIDMMEDDLPLTASRIPHLIKTNKPFMGVKEAVRLYIRNSPKPVPYSEILEEFGDRRGINTNGLCHAILVGQDIIEVAQATYWSMDNLNMDISFMDEFDRAIQHLAMSTKREAGLFYEKRKLIPSFKNLPELSGSRWTDSLLRAAFKHSSRYKAYGEEGNCIVDLEANPEVKNIETFYWSLLDNRFYGWSSFEKFREYCSAHQIRTDLEPEFFDAFDTIEASPIAIECK